MKAFLEASLRGWDYALDHPEEMIELIYARYSQRHSREHLIFEAEQTKRLILPDVVEIGYMNPGRWQRISEIYAEMNMAPEELSLDDFIYDPNPSPNLTWFYLSLLGALVARTFKENLRASDFPGRIGGDEFGILLPNTDLDSAFQLAERLR